MNRRSQEGEYFYLGRDHHFNYDDFRLSMVEHAEKVGVRLEATRRLDRGDVTYAPRTKEIYDAKAEGREPVQRERVGRDLDRALAEIATTSKVYLSLSAEATNDNREDISNALFRAGEVLARGGQLQTDGDVYMENQQSFDDLKTSLTDRLNRIESQIQSASEADRPRMEKQLDSALQPVAHLNPVGANSSKLTTAPSDTGVYSETNVNKDGIGAMRDPETRAQIETALRGTGISSEAVIARVEQGANNASLEQRWIADDLTKIAETEGLNLERKADLEVAAEKLDQAHVRLGEALQRAEVIKDDGVVLDDGDAELEAMRENAETETYREAEAERLATESGIDRAEVEGIAEAERQEAVTDAFNQNMRAMERAGMPASVIGGYTVQMTERAEERIADNPELIQMAREDRREFERLEENLVQTQEFRDGENDQALQQDRQAEFDAFAAKSPAHAQLASRAWDKLGDDMEKPATYVQTDQSNTLRADMSDREIVADIDRGVREQFDERSDEYTRFEPLSIERNQVGGVVNGSDMGLAFTSLAQSRNDADLSPADQRRIEVYLQDTADRYGEQMRDGLARDNQPETDRFDPDYDRDSEAAQEWSDARVREFDNAIRPYRTDQAETAEMRRVIEHERTEKIEGPFDNWRGSHEFRDQIERELDDEQLEALRNGDADALEHVIDERLDRLYAAKAYLQSDAETANSEATRGVVSEIAEEEFDAQRLKTVRADTEKGQTHG
ncbi:hypothetical protein [Yoonia sp. BS5-3]|uniref:Large polyvalent protein-associated domain-containing protein n=1 Tax=Yoonia phaeophyticola TaxID=3137369 RepID=A0ABZ2VA01_9RHOB